MRLLLGIATATLLAACGSDTSDTSGPDGDPTTEPTTEQPSGPTSAPTDSPDGDGRLGELVVSWSEADHAGLGDIEPRLTSRLLASDAERAAYLAKLPAGIDTSEAEAVDLEESVIVAGAYGRCMEQGRVLGDPLRFEVYVAAEDQDTSCVWAPLEVEIWEVPREDVGTVPGELAEAG